MKNIKELIKKYPNDEELGYAVRQYVIEADTYNLFNHLKEVKSNDVLMIFTKNEDYYIVNVDSNNTDSKLINFTIITGENALKQKTLGYEEIKSITIINNKKISGK